MFDNLLYQKTSQMLQEDIKGNKLPPAVLLSGPESSGKLTCALEIARILSCTGNSSYERGHWLCDCAGCRRNKELMNMNVLLAGPRDCSLEISAAKSTFLRASFNNDRFLNATRYLFIRAVRKLTMRFNQILWEGDTKLNKIAAFTDAIEEQLEQLSFDKELPDHKVVEEICNNIVKNTAKLEESFMYDSIPIEQIRRCSAWARFKSNEGKKVIIIENAERMQENVRNALLKILEEPPADCVFILTTTRRGAVMPTILSRVRTYDFAQRSLQQETEVIERVFHDKFRPGNKNISDYMLMFLPVTPDEIFRYSRRFYDGILQGQIFQIDTIVKGCASFEPRQILKLFLKGLLDLQKLDESQQSVELASVNTKAIYECWNNVTVYNQSPLASLEKLFRDMASNKMQFSK